MAKFDGFAAGLGDLFANDGGLNYEKGRAMGANTENALAQASERRAKAKAQSDDEEAMVAAGIPRSHAHAASLMQQAGGGFKDLGDMLHQQQEYDFRTTAGDPTKSFSERNIALQGTAPGPVERFGTVGDGLVQDKFSDAAQPTVTPVGESIIKKNDATAELTGERAAHPELFHAGVSTLPPDQQDAVNVAVREGRLDPSKVNSRNARIFAGILTATPGINLNRMMSDAALQRNATFAQRAMTIEAIPEVMKNMVDLGTKVGFNDNRTIGKMQAWLDGEFNDPDYTQYMTVRNDALMTIANTMRGVGMSDQAHKAEIEAANPTMAPAALDAWMKGQMQSLEPRLKQVHRVTHLGDTNTANADPAKHPLAAPDAPGAQPSAPRAFSTIEEAEAAGLEDGTKITVGGRPATWHK